MKLLIKILLTIPIAGFLGVLFLVGNRLIIDEIQQGKWPLQTIAETFGIASWFPFAVVTIMGFVLWRVIVFPLVCDLLNKNGKETK